MDKNLKISLLVFVFNFTVGLILLVPFKNYAALSPFFGSMFFFFCLICIMYFYKITKQSKSYLTSRLTALHKFIFPITVIILLFFVAFLIAFNLFPGNDVGIFIALGIVLLIWLRLSFLLNLKLFHLLIVKDKMVLFDYNNHIEINKNDVKEVKTYFFLYYKIFTHNKVFIILPKNIVYLKTISNPISILKL